MKPNLPLVEVGLTIDDSSSQGNNLRRVMMLIINVFVCTVSTTTCVYPYYPQSLE